VQSAGRPSGQRALNPPYLAFARQKDQRRAGGSGERALQTKSGNGLFKTVACRWAVQPIGCGPGKTAPLGRVTTGAAISAGDGQASQCGALATDSTGSSRSPRRLQEPQARPRFSIEGPFVEFVKDNRTGHGQVGCRLCNMRVRMPSRHDSIRVALLMALAPRTRANHDCPGSSPSVRCMRSAGGYARQGRRGSRLRMRASGSALASSIASGRGWSCPHRGALANTTAATAA